MKQSDKVSIYSAITFIIGLVIGLVARPKDMLLAIILRSLFILFLIVVVFLMCVYCYYIANMMVKDCRRDKKKQMKK